MRGRATRAVLTGAVLALLATSSAASAPPLIDSVAPSVADLPRGWMFVPSRDQGTPSHAVFLASLLCKGYPTSFPTLRAPKNVDRVFVLGAPLALLRISTLGFQTPRDSRAWYGRVVRPGLTACLKRGDLATLPDLTLVNSKPLTLRIGTRASGLVATFHDSLGSPVSHLSAFVLRGRLVLALTNYSAQERPALDVKALLTRLVSRAPAD